MTSPLLISFNIGLKVVDFVSKSKKNFIVKVTYGKNEFKDCLLSAIKAKYENIN